MMDKLGAMRIYIAVVESHGFSAAARTLQIPVPTVSRKIAQLEESLGAQLLVRSTRSVTTTEPGLRYYEDIKRVLEDIDSAERLVFGEHRHVKGLLTITAPKLFGRLHLRPVVNEFMKVHKELQVRLLFTNQVLDFLEEHIDVGVRIGGTPGRSMNMEPIGSIRQIVCASPEYLNRCGRPESPEQLAEHETITFSQLGAQRPWVFNHPAKGEYEVKVQARLLVNAAEDAVESAIQGLGITRLSSYQAANSIESGNLEVILEGAEIDPLIVSILVPGGRHVPQKVDAFIKFARPALVEKLQNVSQMCAR
ncbi:LysR family transcriptional regulator [Gammaproteobacteria bacterium]|nr:LysR family transcriptional regulator [Gammaproteobacteria bacterium]